MRGKIVEFDHCVEVRGKGICFDCKLLVNLDATRIYDDNRFSFCGDDGVWQMRMMGVPKNNLKLYLGIAALIGILSLMAYLVFF